ncbi:MAG: GNAT family N-acetyltransferase [Deltaproteobacteria bacterium]|nr:GNAT family N-acetyltransferase [Deltaproteobacteria bacterium]
MGTSDWKSVYEKKKTGADTALRSIKPGQRVFISSGCAEPRHLVSALEALHYELSDVELIHSFSLGGRSLTSDAYKESFRVKSFFVASGTRGAVSTGNADYMPIHFRHVPKLFTSGRLSLHAALIQVSPPDEHGYCTFGISVDIGKSAAESAETVIAQVNRSMPRVHGDSRIHVDEIDFIVEHEEPLLEYRFPTPTDIQDRIAEKVAGLVDDGSVIAAGLAPTSAQAVLSLRGKKDLGIHTDVLHDAFLGLIESGAVTNRQKKSFPGKVIASCCIGTRRLYDFVHDNPDVELHPTEVVNDPASIALNDKVVSISPAIELDLTGQVCADSQGHRIFSGFGGYADFMDGADLSKGGKKIVVIPSTNPDGSRSRIVSQLTPGSGVVLSRASVQYVVTEFGIVDLFGMSIRERTIALIDIAHPRFRRQLMSDAKRLHYVYEDQALSDERGRLYPDRWETKRTFKEDLGVRFRPIKPTDERALQELYYFMPREDVRTRFFLPMKAFPHRDVQAMCNIDYLNQMTIVGTLREGGGERIVAVAHYIREDGSDTAEVDFAVNRKYQNTGIGSFLINYLIEIARANGLKGFAAYVLRTNMGMVRVFRKTGYRMLTELEEDDVLHIQLRFDGSPAQ